MDKHNNFQKFDLASINCVEYIDDHQAETLSAGLFDLNSLTNRNFTFMTVGTSNQNTNGAIRTFPYEKLDPFRVSNLNAPGAGGDRFRLTLFDGNDEEIGSTIVNDGFEFTEEDLLRTYTFVNARQITIEQI